MSPTEKASLISGIRIAEIFNDCLFERNELQSFPSEEKKHPKECIPTCLITTEEVGFHPERVESYRNEILELLDELPDAFKEEHGGAPLHSAMYDKQGVKWTILPGVIEQLFHLGQAIGKVQLTKSTDLRYVILKDCREVKRVVNS